MTTKRKPADGPEQRTFVPRSWARPPGLFLLGLALVGLVQAGCQSDGCSTCGGFASRLSNKVSNGVQALGASISKHFDGCHGGADCGCGYEGTVVDSGVPISGGMVLPAPGTIVPAPAIESPPTQLEAIPSNTTGGTGSNPASTRSTPSGASRSGYTTSVPRNGSVARRGTDVNRALLSTNDPNRLPEPGVNSDLLDTINIPPVDLPAAVTQKAVSNPPATTSAAKPTAPVTGNAPAAPAATPSMEPAAPPATEKVSAADGAIDSLPPIRLASAYQAPGIRRYASTAPMIGGGSAPTIDGLDWLKEKGYRTFVDLRRGSEIDPNFLEAVADRNMAYISLPIVANRLDPSRLARFDDLISQADNKPLFFCDTDGTRAGLVWYLHTRVISQEDSQSAATKAEEIGLTAVEVKLAEAYLAIHKPKAKSAMAKVAMVNAQEPKVEPIPVVPTPAPPASALPSSTGASQTVLSPASAPVSNEPSPPMLPGEHKPQASTTPENFHEPAYLRPVAGLILTAIGVPLAYWSRSAISFTRTNRKRASLPGAAPRSLDAPDGSDA